ncbi:MAG TPA: helix-turn-helix transcriptional regulator [Pseudobdellovibrionaceae bacterium]|nr:helix-turn-helix transcriptional regulator [Pseudobdellovibrionaceae bacterium]
MYEPNLIFQNSLKKKINQRIDYRAFAIEVIKKLRGEMNQRTLSHQLGYSFNQIGKWESSVTQVKWENFLDICAVLQKPIEATFRRLFWTFDGEFSPEAAIQTLARNLKLNPHLKKKYQTKLKKWEQSEQMPDLAEALEIIDLVPSMLIAFLSGFMDVSEISILSLHYKQYLEGMDLLLQDPVCGFVNGALKVKEYKNLESHDDSILAHHSTCSIEHLRKVLSLMLAHGAITYDGKKYQPSLFDFSYSMIPSLKLRGLTKYVTDLASERYSLQPLISTAAYERNASTSSVRVNALSNRAAKKISDLISEFHTQIGEIVLADAEEEKNNVQVILIHSFASTVNKQAP